MLSSEQSTSIPLIYLNSDPQPKFIINPKAIQLIKQFSSHQPISFISICGQYRSGKSFLMNSLFFSNQGFKVSPTTQPCTKGINIWSKPISYNGKNMWVLDTQGFGAIDRDDSYDVKIFLLTTMLSQILMYNSFGALDQNSINKLAAICKKAQTLDPTISQLKMFWILRDFSLTIENKQGKILSPNQYLQLALDDNSNAFKTSSQLPSSTKTLPLISSERQAIKKVFRQSHCVPLVRPVIDQTLLSQLNQIKFQQLRGQFVQQIYKLRKKMLSCLKAKYIQGVQLTGQNLERFIGQYLSALNNNQVQTHIQATWQKVISHEKQKYIEKLKTHFRVTVNKQIEKIEKSDEQPYNDNKLIKFCSNLHKQLEQPSQQLQKQQSNRSVKKQNSLSSHKHLSSSLTQQLKKHFSSQQVCKQILLQIKSYLDQELIPDFYIKNKRCLMNKQQNTLKQIFQGLEKSLLGGVTGGQNNVEKFVDKIFRTKDEYFVNYEKYLYAQKGQGDGNQNEKNFRKFKQNDSLSQSSKLLYFQNFYFNQKNLLPKIIAQSCQQAASSLIKINQLKKHFKKLQSQTKLLKQQNQKFTSQYKQLNKQLTIIKKSQIELKNLLQEKQQQLNEIKTKYYSEFFNQRQEFQANIQELKQTILGMEKNFLQIKKEHELEKSSYDDKIKYLEEKNQLITTKVQQIKAMGENSVQKVKQQYQQKLKKHQQRYQQLQNQFHVQRKKFLQLNKSKKQQQSQLLQDLAEKNEKLLNLRRQVVSIQHMYKQQIHQILQQQKIVIQNDYNLLIEEKNHLITVYQQKLEQFMIRVHELEGRQQENVILQKEYRLLKEEHQSLVGKYKEILDKLKRFVEDGQERQQVWQEKKKRYQSQIQSKEQVMRKLKNQLKTIEQQNTKQIQQQKQKHQHLLNQIKQNLQAQYRQKISQKQSNLQKSYKIQKTQLLEQLKDGFKEIQQLKLIKSKQQNFSKNFNDFLNKVNKELKCAQKQKKKSEIRYKKLYEKMEENAKQNDGKMLQNAQNISQILEVSQEQSQILVQLKNQQHQNILENIDDDEKHLISEYQMTGQTICQTEQTLIQFILQHKLLYQQKQSLCFQFKQTIIQLQQCQSHILTLNGQLKSNQSNLIKFTSVVQELKQLKSLHQSLIQKCQSLQKQNNLLKKQVQIRDQIYKKRQYAIKQNVELYKQTINNFNQENSQLTERCNKLEIQLNRFVDWEGDFAIGGNSPTGYNHKSKSYFGSGQYLTGENQQEYDQYALVKKIEVLEKQNRKLRKQLQNQKQQLIITNSKSANNLFTSPKNFTSTNKILQSSNLPNQHIIQSMKKENLLYKKRVEQLRQRELKLLDQIKHIKNSQKQSSQTRITMIKEQFQQYRKRTKDELKEYEEKIEELNQQKYKIKQEMLLMRQNQRAGVGFGTNNGSNSSVDNNNCEKINNKIHSFSSVLSQKQKQPLLKTIQTLTLQNKSLMGQITILKSQFLSVKQSCDKLIAEQQVKYESIIHLQQRQKQQLMLQSQKIKAKYQQLLRVNSQLIKQVDNYKSKVNNSQSLKEKYKNKIATLFLQQQ